MSPWPALRIYVIFCNYLFNLFKAFNNLNSVPPICILSRFYKPCISFLRLKNTFILGCFFIIFLIIAYLLTSSLILLNKIFILFITYFLNMECYRNIIKRVYFLRLEIIPNVYKKGFFIRKIPIIL
jgi:hypothetical protein